jgi:hypothetical protein
MPSTIGSSLGLTLPTDGADDDVWGAEVNVILQSLIDAIEAGVSEAGITIGGNLSFYGYNLTACGALQMTGKTSAYSTTYSLYIRDGELYYNDSAGNQVKLTSGGALNFGSVGGIGGDFGSGAEAVDYNAANTRYDFTSASSTYAGGRFGKVIFMSATSAQTCTVKAPDSLASATFITLPTAASIAATGLVLGTSSGGDTLTLSTTTAPSVASLTLSGAMTSASAAISGAATTGTLTNAGLITTATLTATGATATGNLTTTGTASVSGTATVGNLTSAGTVSGGVVTTAEGQARHGTTVVHLNAAVGRPTGGTWVEASGYQTFTTEVGAMNFNLAMPLGSRLRTVTAYVTDSADVADKITLKAYKSLTTSAAGTKVQLGSTQNSNQSAAIQAMAITGLTETTVQNTNYWCIVTFNIGTVATTQSISSVAYTYDRVA